jgi:hypothetical protein
MEWTKITNIVCILVLLFSTAGCIQPSLEKNEILTTYSHPEAELTMKYPLTWDVNRTLEPRNPNSSRVIFSSPGNQASFEIEILHRYHPEDMEEGGIGLGYDVPNSTTIEFQKPIQISGLDASSWTFLVKDYDREYIDGFIAIKQRCPELQNNRIYYFINYDYPKGDDQLEKTVHNMLDSILLTCPTED